MSRALRYSPPVADHDLIVRPRLLAHLRQRFERRVTALVAAPGFGKTTLLAQALSENALAPLGADHWLTCQQDDRSLSFLAEGVFSAVGMSAPVPDDPNAAAVAVAETIWTSAPHHLAIVLDDAHLIEAESPGAAFLRGLVRELPRNGHVVLASRPPLSLAMSRMRATGEAVVLDESEMQFRDDELAAFAQSRGVSAGVLGEVGGWPALAELTATVGQQAAEGFVWEELLSQLTVERREALSLLSAVGGADREIAAAIFGNGMDLDRLLAGLPLIVQADAGWRSLHGLWGWALQSYTDPERIARARRTAGEILRRRGQFHDAMSLFIDAGAWAESRGLIVEVCEAGTPLVPRDVLDVWSHRLPDDVRHSPEGLLLSAMAVEPRNPAAAERLLEQALALAGDDTALRYACLNAVVLLEFWRSNRARMPQLAAQLAELGRHGHREAPAWVALVNALLARSADDVRAELAAPSLASEHGLNPVQDWFHAHIVLRRLGDPETAGTLARRALAHDSLTMRAVPRSILAESLRMRGMLEDARAMLPDILHSDLEPAKILTSPELVTGAVVLFCVLGQSVQAGELLDRFGPTVDASAAAWGPIAGAVGRAFHRASTGDDAVAIVELQPIAESPLARSPLVIEASVAALPVLYVLLPEHRERWDATPQPGYFADVIELVHALVDLREGRRLELVRNLSPAALRVAPGALPPPWTAELAAGLVTAGRDEGRELLERLGPSARSVLRSHVDDARSPITKTARALLRELPSVPTFHLDLHVLGPLRLWRDGVELPAPGLRRERVRQLLAYLLGHERPTRAAITAELWPDLDDAAGARNLRVTLAYLQDVFEPDRTELDPPFFVRGSEGVLRLHVGDATEAGALDVDAFGFERVLDEAALLERQGAPSAALDAYVRALALWRGEYFVDLSGDWLQWERDRLRGRFLASATRAGDLLLARGDTDDACALAQRALVADESCEAAYQVLVAAALTEDDLVTARRHLRRCMQMLRDLRVAPQERTVLLARQVAAD